MADTPDRNSFANQLLRQDKPLNDSEYRAYRERLADALVAAERRVLWTGRICAGSFVVSLALMFVGGSKLIGSFDPGSKDATFWSVGAGAVYWLATIVFFLSLASYYSRLRPRVRDTKDELRDAVVLDLERQLRELRERTGPT